jgi:hypothetical protein
VRTIREWWSVALDTAIGNPARTTATADRGEITAREGRIYAIEGTGGGGANSIDLLQTLYDHGFWHALIVDLRLGASIRKGCAKESVLSRNVRSAFVWRFVGVPPVLRLDGHAEPSCGRREGTAMQLGRDPWGAARSRAR